MISIFKKVESLKKVKSIFIKSNTHKDDTNVDEIIGEFKIYDNQALIKHIYKFSDGVAVSCFIIEEYYSSEFQEIIEEVRKKDNLIKNYIVKDNIITYEWSEEFFEQKGKGCSPNEIKKFLKSLKNKVKVKYNK